MNQEKKHELSQLLSEAMQYISIQKQLSRIPDISVNDYKFLLHKELGENAIVSRSHKNFEPHIAEETISNNLLNFIDGELSEHINTEGLIGIYPGPYGFYYELHELCKYLYTQLLRITLAFGIGKAVSEFNRCFTENTESIQYYMMIRGIEVEHEIQIFDGIRLIPLPNGQPLLQDFLRTMPEELVRQQHNAIHNNYIRGDTLAIIDFAYSPIFYASESPPTGILRQLSFIKVGDKELNGYDESTFLKGFLLALSSTLGADMQIYRAWEFYDPFKLANLQAINSTGYGTHFFPKSKTFAVRDVDEFEMTFDMLCANNTNTHENINRAINRLLESKKRKSPVDKMIDLRIALEALYLPDQTSMEMSFRLSNRAAWHLGKDIEDRKKLQKFFKTIYRVSSSSVHSENFNDREIKRKTKDIFNTEGLDGTEFIAKSQELCQDAIQKFLESEEIPKSAEDWSDLTLGGETFK